MPSEEETVKEQQVQGLSRKQHYAQYVQVATELEDMLLGEDTAKEQMAKAIEYLHGAAHLREVAWQMTGVGLHRLHLALAGTPPTFGFHHQPNYLATGASTLVPSVGMLKCLLMGHTTTFTLSIWGSCSNVVSVLVAVVLPTCCESIFSNITEKTMVHL